jgi:hypothetical protein
MKSEVMDDFEKSQKSDEGKSKYVWSFVMRPVRAGDQPTQKQ